MKRTYRYHPDGTSYEVTKPKKVPAVHFLHTSQAIGADGKPIKAAKLRDLNRQGKALHVEEVRNIALDAHNEHQRQQQNAKDARKAALVDAFHGHGHH